jgi:hypothetical protein
MNNMRRQLSIRKMKVNDEHFGYSGNHKDYNDNMLVQRMASLSMPSDFDDYDVNLNNNTGFGYDTSEELMDTGLADPVVDLDRMIAETSARWKCTVSAIVNNTVTANTTSVSSATLSSSVSNGTNPNAATTASDSITYFTNVNSASSTGSQSKSNSTPAAIMESSIISTPNSSVSAPQSLVGIQSTIRRPQIVSRQNSTGTHSVISVPSSMEHQVIEQQQAEIQALHAAIHAQQRQQQLQLSSMNGFHQNRARSGNFPHIQQQQQLNHQQYASSYTRFVPGMSALNENSVTLVGTNNNNTFSIINFGSNSNGGCVPFNPFVVEEKIDCAPIEHIEVNHHDASFWQDDLTVWSGFNTVTGTPESPSCSEPPTPSFSNSRVDYPTKFDDHGKLPTSPRRRPDAESATGASALNGVPVRVVQGMEVKLASGMTGITRKATYSGTINAHTRQPEGQGTFTFTLKQVLPII